MVADIYTGAIWRVAIEDESVTRAYQHAFGVNSAEVDSTGAIWFTQSTENTAGAASQSRMFAAVDKPIADGGLYRIALPGADGVHSAAELVAGGLTFANGLAVDENRGAIYLAETMADRVVGYRVDFKTGALSDRRIVAQILTPDNLKLDDEGRLWVASPLGNEIAVVDPESGIAKTVFRAATADSERVVTEWRRRVAAGEPGLELFTPDVWAPLPGAITSVILAPERGPVYVSGLGDALLKLDR